MEFKVKFVIIGLTCAHGGLRNIRRYASVYKKYARVVELVDTLALGASAFGREGSSPFARTIEKCNLVARLHFSFDEFSYRTRVMSCKFDTY